MAFISSINLVAQDTLSIDSEPLLKVLDSAYVDVLPYTSIHIDSTRKLTIDAMKRVPMKSYTLSDSIDFDSDIFRYPIWFKIPIRKTNASHYQDLTLVVIEGMYFEYYEVTNDTIINGIGGLDAPKSKNGLTSRLAIPLKVLDSTSGTLYIKLNGQRGNPFMLHLYEVENAESFIAKRRHDARLRLSFYPAFTALMLFTGLFFLFRYFQFSERYLLWYSLYLIAMGLFYLDPFERFYGQAIIFQYLDRPLSVKQFFRPLPWLFFCLYLRDILGMKKGDSLYKYYQFMLWSALFALLSTLVITVLRLGFYVPIQTRFFIYVHIPLAIIGTLLALQIFRKKDALFKLIGGGMLLIILGAIIYLILSLWTNLSTFLFYEIGILLEILFLNQAIGLKMKRTNKALLDTQKSLVEAEQENLKTQKQLNNELQQLVEDKTAKIIAKSEQLISEEKLKLAAEFNQKIANAELKALKAQMNPHFIFNCLNAIRNLVQQNHTEQAMDYLADFASFIRKVLSYSEAKQITLEEELELCELYLKMEHLRFKEGFEYDIKIEPNTAIDFIMLPPMLLQPLLENAIWHGLLHKEGSRKITILIEQTEKEVICTIDDNGVGRAHASKHTKSPKRESIGMKLFLERLDINNKLLDSTYNYEIIDKYENQDSLGTQVKLYFEL